MHILKRYKHMYILCDKRGIAIDAIIIPKTIAKRFIALIRMSKYYKTLSLLKVNLSNVKCFRMKILFL